MPNFDTTDKPELFRLMGELEQENERLKAELARQRETIRELGLLDGRHVKQRERLRKAAKGLKEELARTRNGLRFIAKEGDCSILGPCDDDIDCGSDECIDLIINAANDGGM